MICTITHRTIDMFSYIFIKADLMTFNTFFNSSLETTPIYSNVHPLTLSIFIRNIMLETCLLKLHCFFSVSPILLLYFSVTIYRSGKKYFTSFFLGLSVTYKYTLRPLVIWVIKGDNFCDRILIGLFPRGI